MPVDSKQYSPRAIAIMSALSLGTTIVVIGAIHTRVDYGPGRCSFDRGSAVCGGKSYSVAAGVVPRNFAGERDDCIVQRAYVQRCGP